MAQCNVLIVDDEPQIVKTLRLSLSAAGHNVLTAANASETLDVLRRETVDTMIIDLGLPDRDGKEVIAEVRQWSDLPIIVLSARHLEGEKIAALDAGASDYVNKPFSMGELLARLRVALRLHHSRSTMHAYRSHGLAIDFAARQVVVRGKEMHLTPKEFDLLRVLAQHAGQVVTRNQLLSFVWGVGEKRDSQILRVLVGQLRQKIEADPRVPALLLTEPGIGYRLRAEGEEET
ncbi:MAG TPA: response regulator transcription factor, partial [Dongiaceae bacterium]|jgi:two-component system KDP operon response regulator KdpE|nr:response regulator transcription factor [Dongiaceae bacterium]